jgi:cyanophycinase
VTSDQNFGLLALVGSGEYLPQMTEFEASLLEGRPPRYVQLATAAVPDGPEVVEKWHRLGRAQAQRLGVEAVVLLVHDRDDANNEDLANQIAGAGLIYLSGGNPGYLADTLRDSLVWKAIETAWRSGTSLAGCTVDSPSSTRRYRWARTAAASPSDPALRCVCRANTGPGHALLVAA